MCRYPRGRVRMQVGGNLAGDKYRFAVGLHDKEKDLWIERMTISQAGEIALHKETAVCQNLTINPYPPETDPCQAPSDQENLLPGLFFEPLATIPDAAKPWQIYRTILTPDEIPAHQLRFEFQRPGEEGAPSDQKITFGFDDLEILLPPDSEPLIQPGYTSCLTILGDGTVVVEGNVVIGEGGGLVEGPIPADPNDPRFAGLLFSSWIDSISSAANQVDFYYSDTMAASFVDLPDDNYQAYTIAILNRTEFFLTSIMVEEVVIIGDNRYQQRVVDTPALIGP